MFVTVFYVVVFISGLLGNLSVIAVVVRSKGLHSAMNYYLISLAMADILIIILGELFFGPCKLYNVKCYGRRKPNSIAMIISCVGTMYNSVLYVVQTGF